MINYPACLCGANNYRVYNYETSALAFSVIACRACSLARTWPVPLEDLGVDDFYKAQTSHDEKFGQLDLRRKFARLPLDILSKYKSDGALLDVGCSVGVFVDEAKRRGFKAQGIDLSATAIHSGQVKLNLGDALSVGSLATKNFPIASFDVITYLHCFEHLIDPVAELKEVTRVLSADGILVIEVPNFFSIWRLALGRRWYPFSPLQHIWQFGKEGLKNLLCHNGFAIINIKTRLSMYHKITLDFQGFIKLCLYCLAWISGKGDDLIIIARKKI